jgi:hypothetical protein
MPLLRSTVAVVAGLVLFRLLVTIMETALVGAYSESPITSDVEYFAVRNQAPIMAAAPVYYAAAALLAGTLMARIARAREVMHAMIAASALTAALVWGFTASEYAAFTPVWLRVALVLVTGPAMVAGAAVRAKAARSG